MAKKKTSTKKHRFKYAQPTGLSENSMSTPASSPTATGGHRPVAATIAPGEDYSYVGRDLRRLSVLAVSLLAIELIIWVLFGHTGLGDTVDSWIHV